MFVCGCCCCTSWCLFICCDNVVAAGFRQKRSEPVKFWLNCVPGSRILCEGRLEQTTQNNNKTVWNKCKNSLEQCFKTLISYFLFARLSRSSSLIQNLWNKSDKYFAKYVVETCLAKCWLNLLTDVHMLSFFTLKISRVKCHFLF